MAHPEQELGDTPASWAAVAEHSDLEHCTVAVVAAVGDGFGWVTDDPSDFRRLMDHSFPRVLFSQRLYLGSENCCCFSTKHSNHAL